jgi:hypothetical protein
MSNKTVSPALALANTYASYFVEDFTAKVMGHLKGSHSIPPSMLEDIIQAQVSQTTEPMKIANTGAVGRFLFECANFALEHSLPEMASRDTWNELQGLPSMHHAEINAIAFASADLCRLTVDQTVVGTIAKDADTAAQMITQAAAARSNDTETGGTFNLFSWGILNDGLWLQGALMRAQDRCSIYKPDTQAQIGWASQAFNFAQHNATFTPIDRDQRQQADAEINLLIGTLPQETVTQLLEQFSQAQLNDLLFSSAKQRMYISQWDHNRGNATDLIRSVGEMSAVARMLDMLQNAAVTKKDGVEISDEVRERLSQAVESVTLALVGYEVMRETRYGKSLIMSVHAQDEDPRLDVFVNSDTITNFRAAYGSDEELVQFAHHLDPRQGMPAASAGWSLEYVMDRRDTVLPQVMAQQAERLETLRRNDATVIRTAATNITRGMVQSYLAARNIQSIPSPLSQQINRLSQDVIGMESMDSSIDVRMAGILAEAQGDPFVQKATDLFVNYLGNESVPQQYARAATVAALAFSEAVDFITGADLD